jgi:hypothetical protein
MDDEFYFSTLVSGGFAQPIKGNECSSFPPLKRTALPGGIVAAARRSFFSRNVEAKTQSNG